MERRLMAAEQEAIDEGFQLGTVRAGWDEGEQQGRASSGWPKAPEGSDCRSRARKTAAVTATTSAQSQWLSNSCARSVMWQQN